MQQHRNGTLQVFRKNTKFYDVWLQSAGSGRHYQIIPVSDCLLLTAHSQQTQSPSTWLISASLHSTTNVLLSVPSSSPTRDGVYCTFLLLLSAYSIPSFRSVFLIFVVPCIMLYSSEISPTRCNNCVFILRNGFTLHVSGDNLTHHQDYICCIWPQVSRLT